MVKQGELVLQTGRALSLTFLKQWLVYGGQLEGLPTREKNQYKVADALTQARTLKTGEPYLIAPRETPIPYPPGRKYPFGDPAKIPSIGCIGRFHSHQHARDSAKDYSELVVVWFQDDFAFPIDPTVLEQLRQLEWERLAQDYEI
jgi:hypothetical protein